MSSKVKIGIIGGTGLDDPQILENKVLTAVKTPYGDPSDELIQGTIDGVPCVLLARHGRNHSIPPHAVNYRANIWALKSLGCTHVLASTASGSLAEHIAPGTFVLLDNFIDRTYNRQQTLYDGNNPECKGISHIPMEPPVCMRTREMLLKAGSKLKYECVDGGTCVTIQGPRFSTKAESMLFKAWGAHIVNMTAMPELVVAKEAGLLYASIAVVTDYDCWHITEEKVSASNVVEAFKKNVEKVKLILVEAVKLIASEQWDDTIQELQETIKSSIML